MHAWVPLALILAGCLGCSTTSEEAVRNPEGCRMVRPTGSRIARQVCGAERDGRELLGTATQPGDTGVPPEGAP